MKRTPRVSYWVPEGGGYQITVKLSDDEKVFTSADYKSCWATVLQVFGDRLPRIGK